jgi:hypothetical protein
MAWLEQTGDRYSVRWRERIRGRQRMRRITAPDEATATLVCAAVDRDVALHGYYLGPQRPRRRPYGRYDGFVYFVEAAGRIKIGYACDPNKRLDELRCGCPVEMTLLGTLRGTSKDEADWHRRFAARRLHGEWFDPTDELRAAISEAVS